MPIPSEQARKVAQTIRTVAAHTMYGFKDRKPSAIYIHSDGMRGTHASEVLGILNPRVLSRFGIQLWKAMESQEVYPDSVIPVLESQSDARPGVTFSRVIHFPTLNRLMIKRQASYYIPRKK